MSSMQAKTPTTVVIVPGLRDHVADHWQTLLQARLAPTRQVVSVPPLRVDGLNCAARVEAVQQTLQSVPGPVIVVAHSGGVVMLLHWAQKYRAPITGALLAAPPDFARPLPAGYPTLQTLQDNGWLPLPSAPLPFPSIVAASTNDPLASYASVEAMARQWGSRLVNVGAVGHLNPAAGYGDWPRADDFIAQLDGDVR